MAIKLSKDEWVEWCKNPVTERFLVDFNERVNQEMWNLAEGAGTDSSNDARSSGKIVAWGEVLNWKPEEFMIDAPMELRDAEDDSDV